MHKHYDNVLHGRESIFIFCVFPVYFHSKRLLFLIDFSNLNTFGAAKNAHSVHWKSAASKSKKRRRQREIEAYIERDRCRKENRKEEKNVNKPPPHHGEYSSFFPSFYLWTAFRCAVYFVSFSYVLFILFHIDWVDWNHVLLWLAFNSESYSNTWMSESSIWLSTRTADSFVVSVFGFYFDIDVLRPSAMLPQNK